MRKDDFLDYVRCLPGTKPLDFCEYLTHPDVVSSLGDTFTIQEMVDVLSDVFDSTVFYRGRQVTGFTEHLENQENPFRYDSKCDVQSNAWCVGKNIFQNGRLPKQESFAILIRVGQGRYCFAKGFNQILTSVKSERRRFIERSRITS